LAYGIAPGIALKIKGASLLGIKAATLKIPNEMMDSAAKILKNHDRSKVLISYLAMVRMVWKKIILKIVT
jgi:hypothetical protein